MAIGSLVSHKEEADEQTRPGNCALVLGSSYTKSMSSNNLRKRGSQNNPYPTAFPYGNGMVLHFYQQQESSTTKTVHKVINKGLKTYV